MLNLFEPALRKSLHGTISARWQSLIGVDDVIIETFAEVFGSAARLPTRQSEFENWIVTAARNNLRDAIKSLSAVKRGGKLHRVAPVSDEEGYVQVYEMLSSSGTTPTGAAKRDEQKHLVLNALNELPKHYREVVVAYDLEQRPVDEVAHSLDISQGALFMRRKRAHQLLRDLLGASTGYSFRN